MFEFSTLPLWWHIYHLATQQAGYTSTKEYDGAYFVFAFKCFALSVINVKQMVTMIQIRHTDKNTPLQFYNTVVYAIQLEATNENAILQSADF